jgi:hypothetical protein
VYNIKHYFRCLSVNLLHNNIGSLSGNTLHPPFSPKVSLRSFHFRIPFTKPDKLGSVNTRRKSEPFSSPVSSLLVERDRIGLKRCNRDLGFAWKSSSVGGVKVSVGACADIGVADPGVMAGVGDDPGVMAGVGGKAVVEEVALVGRVLDLGSRRPCEHLAPDRGVACPAQELDLNVLQCAVLPNILDQDRFLLLVGDHVHHALEILFGRLAEVLAIVADGALVAAGGFRVADEMRFSELGRIR